MYRPSSETSSSHSVQQTRFQNQPFIPSQSRVCHLFACPVSIAQFLLGPFHYWYDSLTAFQNRPVHVLQECVECGKGVVQSLYGSGKPVRDGAVFPES
jgi:hypothetical protein